MIDLPNVFLGYKNDSSVFVIAEDYPSIHEANNISR